MSELTIAQSIHPRIQRLGEPQGRHVTVGFGIALAAFAFVVVAGFLATTSVAETSSWVEHTHDVLDSLGEERVALAEATAMRRAYGLTGDDSFLDDYADAVGRVRAHARRLRDLTADSASQQREVDELLVLVERRIAISDAAVARKQQNAEGVDSERQQMKVEQPIDDRILSNISGMLNEETRLLAERRRGTAESVRDTRLLLLVGAAMSSGILLIVFVRLRREIAQRVESERVVRESEERIATTLMSIGDGVISTDAEGHVDRMNRIAEELTGWAAPLASGKPVSEVFRIIDEESRQAAPDPVEQALRQGAPVALANHTLLVRKDGSELPVADSCAPVRDATGSLRGAILVFRDLTEAQRAKKLQDTIQRQMIFSDRMVAVGTLAAGVAHEINNPLAYVMGNLDLVLEEIRGFSGAPSADRMKELEQMTVEALQGAHRVQKIVRGLKTFSRADEERLTVLDVRSVLELAINMTFNEIRHRATLVKDYGSTPLVEVDEARLGQVFINLLVNAAQATPEGNAAAHEIRITTSTDEAGRAVVEVRDTGAGIPPELLPRIFDPFFTTKPVGVGTGLGLSICHTIVTGIGGEIAVSSELGHGATFRVRLPSADGSRAVHASDPPRQMDGSRAAVLVVDDERQVGTCLARVLREHDVAVVTEAREALKLLAAGKQFDVIFSDLMMPEMSGMEFFDELVRLHPAAAERVVFVTGGAFTPTAKEFLDRVPNARLEKPFDNGKVRAIVQQRVRACA